VPGGRFNPRIQDRIIDIAMQSLRLLNSSSKLPFPRMVGFESEGSVISVTSGISRCLKANLKMVRIGLGFLGNTVPEGGRTHEELDFPGKPRCV
jgi:hypothetical protein